MTLVFHTSLGVVPHCMTIAELQDLELYSMYVRFKNHLYPTAQHAIVFRAQHQ